MSDTFQQILIYSRLFWHQRWKMFIISFCVCLVGWVVVFALPNKYESSTKIFLDTKSVLKPLLKGLAVEEDVVSETANILRRTLLSRPNLERLMRDVDLDIEVTTPEEKEKLLVKLAKKIQVAGGGREKIYTISYVANNPVLAKNVVQVLMDIFIETALGATRKDKDEAQIFLDSQIKLYEDKLIEAENLLKNFKTKNVGLMPQNGATYFSLLAQANQQLRSASLELQEAEFRRDEFLLKTQQLAEQYSESSAIGSPSTSSPLQERINKLEAHLDELLLVYTNNHPDVLSVKQSLKLLNEQQSKEQTRLIGKNKKIPFTRENIAYQELQVATSKAEAEVAALQARVSAYSGRVKELQSKIDTIPTVEAELAKLNRDYGILRSNYEELVKRRESAMLTQEAEKSVDNVTFKIIEPPIVPILPTGPNRVMLIPMVFILGLGVAAGIIFLLSQIRDTFNTRDDLISIAGVSVIGEVSYIFDVGIVAKRRLEFILFLMAFGMLFVLFLTLLISQILGFDVGFSKVILGV